MNQVHDNLQCWDQCDQEEDQRVRPLGAGEIVARDAATDIVENHNRNDLEDIGQQWNPCLVVLVRVRDRLGQLCPELEDDEGNDKSDAEDCNASDRNATRADVLAYPWKA